jgi:hypothetical protein
MFFVILGSCTTVSLILVVVWKIYELVTDIFAKRRDNVNQIIFKIHSTLEDMNKREIPWITINRLREIIIEPSQMKEWKEAISYIENNDSRFHFGMKCIENMDLRVIRINNFQRL